MFAKYNASSQQPKTDLVMSAFTLGDTPSEALRRSALESLWNQTGDVLVLIERGTPVGFQIIAQAREWILETNSDVQKPVVDVVAPVRIYIFLIVTVPQSQNHTELFCTHSQCPHDKPCPLFRGEPLQPDRDWS